MIRIWESTRRLIRECCVSRAPSASDASLTHSHRFCDTQVQLFRALNWSFDNSLGGCGNVFVYTTREKSWVLSLNDPRCDVRGLRFCVDANGCSLPHKGATLSLPSLESPVTSQVEPSQAKPSRRREREQSFFECRPPLRLQHPGSKGLLLAGVALQLAACSVRERESRCHPCSCWLPDGGSSSGVAAEAGRRRERFACGSRESRSERRRVLPLSISLTGSSAGATATEGERICARKQTSVMQESATASRSRGSSVPNLHRDEATRLAN